MIVRTTSSCSLAIVRRNLPGLRDFRLLIASEAPTALASAAAYHTSAASCPVGRSPASWDTAPQQFLSKAAAALPHTVPKRAVQRSQRGGLDARTTQLIMCCQLCFGKEGWEDGSMAKNCDH